MEHYKPSDNRYDDISYKRCGNSGLLLPPVSLGLWHNFGDVDVLENSKEIVFRSFDLGITHFDLANNYGLPPGSAEENFGKILKKHLHAYRDELIISSKAGFDMWQGPYGNWGSRKYLVASLDQSLNRMGLDYVDIFYSHRPDPNTPLEETMGALAQVVKQGKALYAGISNYDAETTKRASEILDSLGTPCLIHQPRYSMLDRWVEDSLLEVLDKKGIGCICFSPLAQGLLTDKYIKDIPNNSRAAKPHGFLQKTAITPGLRKKLVKLNQIALRRGQSLAQMALAWILKEDSVTSVLIGASSVNQLEDSFKCLENTDFAEDELVDIERILTTN